MVVIFYNCCISILDFWVPMMTGLNCVDPSMSPAYLKVHFEEKKMFTVKRSGFTETFNEVCLS